MNIEILIKLAPLITIVIGIITGIDTYFNKEYYNYMKLKKEYFNKLLVPYVANYRKNKGINPIKYINSNYSYHNIYIPNYIYYLIDKEEKYKLHIVLIVDYMCEFNNEKNSLQNTFYRIVKLAIIIYGFFVAASSIFFICDTINYVINLNKYFNMAKLIGVAMYLCIAIISEIIILGIVFLWFSIFRKIFIESIKEDKYSNELEDIEKQIENKIRLYNASYINWYIN